MSWQVGRATLIRCTISLSFEDKITITGKCTLYSNVALSNLTNTFLWRCSIDPALTGRLWVSHRSENQITAVCESLFLLCADRQQSCDHHRSYQHPADGVNVVWLWVFLLLYLAAPAGSSAKQSEQASIIKTEAHVLLHSSEERIHSVG